MQNKILLYTFSKGFNFICNCVPVEVSCWIKHFESSTPIKNQRKMEPERNQQNLHTTTITADVIS